MAARLVEARALVGMLRARGDHVDVARRVRFELLLPGPVAAPAALDEARLAGFVVVPSTPGRLARLFGPRWLRLRLERVTPVDEPGAEDFTRTLVTLADRYGGRFELWYPDPVGQGRGTGSVR